MKMFLIAGHGAGDPGASGVYNGVKYVEREETRDLVKRLSAALQRRGVDVVMNDPSRNAYEDAKTYKLKFPSGATYLLEIHFNALRQTAEDGKTTGSEAYVTSRESGTTVEDKILAALAQFGFRNRGVKRRDNLLVINRAKTAGLSSCLLEVCFIDDPDDMRVYVAHKQEIADAIAQAICDGFGISPPKTNRQIVQEAAGLNDATMDYLQAYRWGDALLEKLAKAIIGGG